MKRRVLEQLLYHLGRWIYLVDAADDLPEDFASGSYNPLLRRFGLEEGELTGEALLLDGVVGGVDLLHLLLGQVRQGIVVVVVRRQTLNFVENSAGGYRPAGYEVYSTCGKMASACPPAVLPGLPEELLGQP